MEVKIGVQHAPREIVLESGQSAEEVERAVADALAGKAQLLSLSDEKGRKVLIPAEKIAYVELGEPGAHDRGAGDRGGRQQLVQRRGMAVASTWHGLKFTVRRRGVGCRPGNLLATSRHQKWISTVPVPFRAASPQPMTTS